MVNGKFPLAKTGEREMHMKRMIKIEKNGANGDLTKTVNTRELHQFLEVGRDFSTWIKRRIGQYGFEEGVDFCSFLSESTGNRSSKECAFDSPELGNQTSGRGGDRRSIEYHISLDMAKELAMVENNDQGRKARRYFIECERKLKTGGSNTPQIETAKYIFEAVGVAADVLRFSDSGRLAMLHKAASPWPLLQAVLPPYAIDAPTGKESEGSKSHAAIKDICQGIMSAVKANKALLKAGLLEQLERPSTSAPNGIKTYKSVTAKGLKYGLNFTSPNNPRETQPHWYHETADELIEIIKANGV